jgi:hypothetical protein
MDECDLYRKLATWLRSNHPLVFSEWEKERKRQEQRGAGEPSLLQASTSRLGAALDQPSPDASSAEMIRTIQRDLESLGISGGIPGFTGEGTPCVHLTKKGLYGQPYGEDVTLARLRDHGYRRHLRQVFG